MLKDFNKNSYGKPKVNFYGNRKKNNIYSQ